MKAAREKELKWKEQGKVKKQKLKEKENIKERGKQRKMAELKKVVKARSRLLRLPGSPTPAGVS